MNFGIMKKQKNITEEEKKQRKFLSEVTMVFAIMFIWNIYFAGSFIHVVLSWVLIPSVAGILCYWHTKCFGLKGVIASVVLIPLSFVYSNPFSLNIANATHATGLIPCFCMLIGLFVNFILSDDCNEILIYKEKTAYLKRRLLMLAVISLVIMIFNLIIYYRLDLIESFYVKIALAVFLIPVCAAIAAYCFTRLYGLSGLLSLIILMPASYIYLRPNEITGGHVIKNTAALPVVVALIGLIINIKSMCVSMYFDDKKNKENLKEFLKEMNEKNLV